MPRGLTPEKVQAIERRKRVSDLYLRGKTQFEIATEVGINQGNVSRHLQSLCKEWLENAQADFDLKKAKELEKINRLEAIAFDAWERSCRPAESRQTVNGRVSRMGELLPPVVKETVYGQAGDPRFLERVSWCIDTRLRILGAYAPVKVAETTVAGDDKVITEDDRSRIRHILAERLGLSNGRTGSNGEASHN